MTSPRYSIHLASNHFYLRKWELYLILIPKPLSRYASWDKRILNSIEDDQLLTSLGNFVTGSHFSYLASRVTSANNTSSNIFAIRGRPGEVPERTDQKRGILILRINPDCTVELTAAAEIFCALTRSAWWSWL